MNEDVQKIIELAKEIIYISNNLKYAKFAKIYKKQCKNCGKEINVTKKNINYCSELCKREFKRKQQHEYYEKYKQNATEEEWQKRKEQARLRMRELRAKRKGV